MNNAPTAPRAGPDRAAPEGTVPRPPRARIRVRAAVIDLDGTLLDTVADLAAAVDAAMIEIGLAPPGLQTVSRYVGKGVGVLIHRAITGSLDGMADLALHARAHDAFLIHYARENGRQARIYPGVTEGLATMRAAGLRLAVVTNKPGAFTAPLLASTGLLAFFELLVSGDSLPRRKPDPLPMLHACAHFGLPPAQVLAIGDSVNDVQAARAAGMPVFAVPYGYNEGQDVRGLDVDAIVASLADAAALIDYY